MSRRTGARPPLGVRAAAAWTRVYTGRLLPEVATGRRDEIAADLHDHLVDATATGSSSARVSGAVLVRMLLGVPADLSWRCAHARAGRSAHDHRRKEITIDTSSARPLRRTALVLGASVIAWELVLGVGAPASGHAGLDNPVWVTHLVATLVAVVGWVLLVRDRVVGAALLALAAFAMTAVFYWFIPAWFAGAVLVAYFVYIFLRQSDSTPVGSAAGTPRH